MSQRQSAVLPPGDSQENFDCGVHMGTVVYKDATRETAFSKSPCNSQRQNGAWSKNDFGSVSPLMRLLTNVEKDCTECGPRDCFDLRDDGKNPCNVDLGSPNSAPVGNISVLRSSQSKHLIYYSALHAALQNQHLNTSAVQILYQTTFCQKEMYSRVSLTLPHLQSERAMLRQVIEGSFLLK